VDCLYHSPTHVKHGTKGNIRPVLNVLPYEAPSWRNGLMGVAETPNGLLSFLQKHFGKTLALKILKLTLGTLCTWLFVWATMKIINVGLQTIHGFPQEQRYLAPAFALLILVVTLVLIIFMITLFGQKAIKAAVEALDKLVIFIKSLFGVKEKVVQVQARAAQTITKKKK
jgi:hypothetical protein